MKAHFVITSSLSERMQTQIEFLIRSIKGAGRCPDSFFTIFTDDDPQKIKNDYVNSHEVIRYQSNPNLKFPWSVCARWDVVPKADLIIALDSDIIALQDLNPLLEELKSKKGMAGALADGFTRSGNVYPFSIQDWVKLFNSTRFLKESRVEFPDKTYSTPVSETFSESFKRGRRGGLPGCPYYINNGVVSLSSEYVPNIRKHTTKMIQLINSIYPNDFFITQRANTLAAYYCNATYNMPLHVMPKEFNHLEIFYGPPNKNTYFFHYNILRDSKFFSYRKILPNMYL